MTDFKFKETYGIDDLLEIMKILRSPSGCPWDIEQTHKSIKNDFIEEVYEAIEAIDLDDTALLREELGDVLLQVVFHCQIENEKNNFVFADICDELCKKLIVIVIHGISPYRDCIIFNEKIKFYRISRNYLIS